MEMSMWFFQGFTEIQYGRHAWTSYFFGGAKAQKLKSDIRCRWFYWNLKWPPLVNFLARLLILIKKGGLLQLKFGVVGVGVNIYLWAR